MEVQAANPFDMKRLMKYLKDTHQMGVKKSKTVISKECTDKEFAKYERKNIIPNYYNSLTQSSQPHSTKNKKGPSNKKKFTFLNAGLPSSKPTKVDIPQL